MATMYVMNPTSQVALLHRISKLVSSELSLGQMLGEIVGLTAQVTECDACLVYLLERDTGEIVFTSIPGSARRRYLGTFALRWAKASPVRLRSTSPLWRLPPMPDRVDA